MKYIRKRESYESKGGNLNSPKNAVEVAEFFKNILGDSKFSRKMIISDAGVEFTSYGGDFRVNFNKYGLNITYTRGGVFLGRIEYKDLYGVSILDNEVFINFGRNSDLCYRIDW